jgi:hypothetical protein
MSFKDDLQVDGAGREMFEVLFELIFSWSFLWSNSLPWRFLLTRFHGIVFGVVIT